MCVHIKAVESVTEKMIRTFKDYYMSVVYHHGKANMVADALSRMTDLCVLCGRREQRTCERCS